MVMSLFSTGESIIYNMMSEQLFDKIMRISCCCVCSIFLTNFVVVCTVSCRILR